MLINYYNNIKNYIEDNIKNNQYPTIDIYNHTFNIYVTMNTDDALNYCNEYIYKLDIIIKLVRQDNTSKIHNDKINSLL